MQALDDKDVALQDACAATAAAAAQPASRRTPCSATPPAAYPYDGVAQRQHPHVAAESLATAEIEAQGRREDAMAQVDEDVKKCCCFC